jgi:hypothetical protein
MATDHFGRVITDNAIAKIFVPPPGLLDLVASMHVFLASPAALDLPPARLSQMLACCVAIEADLPYAVCPLSDAARYPPKLFPDMHVLVARPEAPVCRVCLGKGWITHGEFDKLPVKDFRQMCIEWGAMAPGSVGAPAPMPPLTTLKPRHTELLQAARAAGAHCVERRRNGSTLVARVDPEGKLGSYSHYLADLVRWHLLGLHGKQKDAGYWITRLGLEAIGARSPGDD